METIKTKTGIFRVSVSLVILTGYSYCQSCYSFYIDSIISHVSIDSISNFNLELTGEIPTVIGGQPYIIISRYWEHPANQKAAQYIYEKFQSYGLETRYQTYSSSGVNVIAKKTGVKYPNKQFIICAHYDNIIQVPPYSDTVYGSDDNASGICCVLEAARILRNYALDYTVIFAAWDEEEIGLIGSMNYADTDGNLFETKKMVLIK
jgi:acetylornithine deacetylase/succinyl-diaminopimelate desuccinylase-like protein